MRWAVKFIFITICYGRTKHSIDNEHTKVRNKKFRLKIHNYEYDGTLLERINDNFKLVVIAFMLVSIMLTVGPTFDIFVSKLFQNENGNFLVQRYGEYILFEPQFNKKNFLLWIFPFSILFVSAIFLLIRMGRNDLK